MIYDFQYLPFSLGDILTWTVHLTVQAQEANWEPEEIRYRHQLRYPHPMQAFIHAGKGKKYLGELPEAFLFNPLGLKTVEEEESHPIGECVRTEYGRDLKNLREESRRGVDIKKQTRFFTRHVASHENLNQYYRRGFKIPPLKTPLPVANQTAKLIHLATGKTDWICLHLRLRGLDTKWGIDDFERNGDPVFWFNLLQTIAASYRQTHAILLMGNTENIPTAFLDIPGVATLRTIGGTLKNDLAAVLGAKAFLGCSSGFAAAANFSRTPYVIFNVTQAGYENYALEPGGTKLPFAGPKQHLIKRGENFSRIDSIIKDVLPKIKRSLVKQETRSNRNAKYNPGSSFVRQTVLAHAGLYKYADIGIHQSYCNKLQEMCAGHEEIFKITFLDLLALKEEVFKDNFAWQGVRRINELREEAAGHILTNLLKKRLISTSLAYKELQRARELSPYNIRYRAHLNLFRIAQKLSFRKIDKRVLLGLMRLWEEWYLLFCQFRSSYRSKSLNP